MVCRVAPYTLGGALYYQGESDENNHAIYRSLLQNLIEEWRRLWQDEELPFAIVQLPVYADTGEETGHGWGEIRKAQQDIYRTVKNTSLTVITDCGEAHNIHPTDKKTVGNRLAENVLKDIFTLTKFNGNGPRAIDYDRTVVGDINGVKVYFEPPEILMTDEAQIDGFEIAGADGEYVSAKASIGRDYVVLYNSEVKEPVKVRYGSKNYYQPVLKDANGRPVMPFWFE
jgi:sialate O-acetylesterase